MSSGQAKILIFILVKYKISHYWKPITASFLSEINSAEFEGTIARKQFNTVEALML